MRITGAGHVLFAATLIGLGLYGLVEGRFGAIWGGVPKALPMREVLVYAAAVVSLGGGAGLLWRRAAPWAAGGLTLWLLAWMALFTGRSVWSAPLTVGPWENAAETAVLAAAAWALFAALATRPAFATGAIGLTVARTIYGLALIVFGLAHFAYLQLTAPLIPDWLPWHVGLAYFTGGAYIAAGLAVISGVLGRLAATLATVQIGLFTLLVWAPKIAAGSHDPSDWSETVISCALTAAAWVLADSYRGAGWLAITSTARARR